MSAITSAGIQGRLTGSRLRSVASTLIVAGALASSIPFGSTGAAQEASTIAGYVPDAALAYAEVNIDQDSAQLEQSAGLLERANLDALLTEEQLEDFENGAEPLGILADGEVGFFLGELPESEVITGVDVSEITDDAGEIAVDPEAAATGDLPTGWAAILHPSNMEWSFALYQELVFGDEGTDPEQIDYNGYTILYREAADESSNGIAIAQIDEVIAIATLPEDIEPVIDTAAGEADPIADSPSYQLVRNELEADVLMFGYLNGPEILASLTAQDPEIARQLPDDLMASLHAHQGLVFWADEPGFRLDTVAFPAEGETLPAPSVYEPTFAANVPASSLFFAGGTDLGSTPGLDRLALMMAEEIIGMDPSETIATPVADPEAYAEQVFAEAEDAIGFNLKTDVLDQLVGEWGVAGSLENITAEVPDFSGVFVTEVSDPATVTEVTTTITNMIVSEQDESVTVSSRQVNGADVTVLEITDDSMTVIVEFGVIDGKLLIGFNDGIDSFLGEQASPLSESENFQATLAVLPAEISSLAYLDVENMLPLVEDAIGMSAGAGTADADPDCGQFESQEEAQAAFDEDTFENFNLDLDFDGEACEDYFTAEATPVATPVGATGVNVVSVGSATYSDDDSTGSSTIILIGE